MVVVGVVVAGIMPGDGQTVAVEKLRWNLEKFATMGSRSFGGHCDGNKRRDAVRATTVVTVG